MDKPLSFLILLLLPGLLAACVTQTSPALEVTSTAAFNTVGVCDYYSLVTTEPIGGIPANTRVRVGYAQFVQGEWVYTVVTEGEQMSAEAREHQLRFEAGGPPCIPTPTVPLPPITPSPTMLYSEYMSLGGYPFVTTEQVGDIPEGTRVRVGGARFENGEWIYIIVAEGEQVSAEAHVSQLIPAPDVTPGPTPTNIFGRYGGLGYLFVTTEQVGDIPAGARVRISEMRFNGQEWIYVIVAEGEQLTAEALADQLAFAPDVTPGATPSDGGP